METVGREVDGFTRREAEEALRERRVDVKREGHTVGRETFASFVDRFLGVGTASRG